MKIPFTCPTCGGHKTVQKPPHIAGDQQTWVAGDTALYPCPSCNGSGILWNESELQLIASQLTEVVRDDI